MYLIRNMKVQEHCSSVVTVSVKQLQNHWELSLGTETVAHLHQTFPFIRLETESNNWL